MPPTPELQGDNSNLRRSLSEGRARPAPAQRTQQAAAREAWAARPAASWVCLQRESPCPPRRARYQASWLPLCQRQWKLQPPLWEGTVRTGGWVAHWAPTSIDHVCTGTENFTDLTCVFPRAHTIIITQSSGQSMLQACLRDSHVSQAGPPACTHCSSPLASVPGLGLPGVW